MTVDGIDSLKLTRLLSDMVANDDDALQRSNLISIAKCIDELQIRLDQTKNIVVFASPKSASTFLARNLQTILGFKWHPLTFSYFENEHDLHLPYLVTAQRDNTVTQVHARATDVNLKLIEIFKLTPIVLIRDIFDSIISYYDHVHRIRSKIPHAHIDGQFFSLDEKTKLDFFVELVAPWFVNFFVSWFRAESNFGGPIHWITFEEVIHQPEETIVKVLDAHEVPVDRALVSNVLLNADVVALGKNKGVQGRGRQLLSASQVEKITQLSRFYPDIDFSLLGIK